MSELKAYTETYRIEFMDRENPDLGWHKFAHSRIVEVLTIGGINYYFVVYTYPPAGFEVARPEDIQSFELWRGLILEYIPQQQYYRVDTYTPTHGYSAFKRRKKELGY